MSRVVLSTSLSDSLGEKCQLLAMICIVCPLPGEEERSGNPAVMKGNLACAPPYLDGVHLVPPPRLVQQSDHRRVLLCRIDVSLGGELNEEGRGLLVNLEESLRHPLRSVPDVELPGAASHRGFVLFSEGGAAFHQACPGVRQEGLVTRQALAGLVVLRHQQVIVAASVGQVIAVVTKVDL